MYYNLKKKKKNTKHVNVGSGGSNATMLVFLTMLLFVNSVNGLNLNVLEKLNTFALTVTNKIQNYRQQQQEDIYNVKNDYYNKDTNILEIIDKETIENYLIYWKRGYIEQDWQLKWYKYIFYKIKIVFWMELIIRPMVYLFLWFPNFYGFGFYNGQEYQEICSSISSISSVMWNNQLYKPLCYEIISKKFNSFLYTSLILVYFFATLTILKNFVYLIKKKC